MKHILIVEDEPSIAQMYQLKLELNGFKAATAHNGLDGLHYIDQYTPDLILLDLMMPVMDGEKFLRKLRDIDKFKDTPVVILTNISREEAPKTLWHHGISAYFIKAHHSPSDLVRIIRNLIT